MKPRQQLGLIYHSLSGEVYYSIYMHLDSMSVQVGDHVNAGDTIAQMGETGSIGYKHLHFEVKTENGVNGYSNPFQFPLGERWWWANSRNELATNWVDISSRFGGYDDFLPEDWR